MKANHVWIIERQNEKGKWDAFIAIIPCWSKKAAFLEMKKEREYFYAAKLRLKKYVAQD